MIDQVSALIVVDMQNDFMPGGALAVADGDQIVPLINRLGRRFANVIVTQDWHPAGHVSFASSHPGRKPFDVVELAYGPQMLWPDHAIQGTQGAALNPALDLPHAQLVIRKGCRTDVDSYSAFFEADQTPTGLGGYLRERGIGKVFVIGLATDFCAGWTAKDARRFGVETVMIEDATRAIDANGSLDAALAAMDAAGVVRIQSAAL